MVLTVMRPAALIEARPVQQVGIWGRRKNELYGPWGEVAPDVSSVVTNGNLACLPKKRVAITLSKTLRCYVNVFLLEIKADGIPF
jgi:hypothetical protein